MNRWRKNSVTPLRIIHTLRMQHAIQTSLDAEECTKFIDWSFSMWSDFASAFIAVLRWTITAFERDVEWRSLGSIARLATIWFHSDKILSLLASNQCSLSAVVEVFSSHRTARVVEEAFVRTEAHDEIAWPEYVSEDVILFHGLGYILGTGNAEEFFTDEQIAILQNLLSISPTADSGHAVSPWIMVNREVGANLLGSFLDMRPKGLFGFEVNGSPEAVVRFEDMVVSQLENEPYSRDGWVNVSILLRPTVSEAAKQRLVHLLSTLDFVTLYSQANEGAFACRLAANCVSRLGDDDLREYGLSQIVAMASKIAHSYGSRQLRFKIGDDTKHAKELAELLEGCALLSKSDKPQKSFETFGSAVVRLADAWPQTAFALTDLMRELYAGTPIPVNKGLWKAWVTLRGRY